MRFSMLLMAFALPFMGLAAKKTPTERFSDYHTKALASSPVKLKDSTYQTLTSTPRDYSVAVLLTALDTRYGCQLCREFHPEWELLSRSWVKGDREGESRLIFGTLDFADGRETFVSLGLQTAPVLLLFQPTAAGMFLSFPHYNLKFSVLCLILSTLMLSSPQSAEFAHSWLAKHLPDRPHPTVKRPFNWVGWISTITIVLGGGTAIVVAWPYLKPVVTNRRIWSAVTLISILLFVSGIMFNHIRKVPYVAGDGKGGVNYIANGFQNQFGLETQIVAAMYGALSFVTIGLVSKVPLIQEPRIQQIAVVAYCAALLVLYSFLLSIFRVKNGGYPFSLPPFM
ncbi:Magnesium transporter protein 1 [Zalerion maritima]|uniref:Magnesium transporter protein 1 n=1 Tax=Zalerion maritima TaxID=339359 RepID=A0AAD5RQ48_9PEZI|nr:Magnesium transporter protein 1 [Zalerion maritima]